MKNAVIYMGDADGYAGTHDQPQLRRLLQRLRDKGDIEYVYVSSFDGVADSPRDLALLKLDIELSGARLVSMSEPEEDLPPAGSQAAIDRRLRDFQRIVNSAGYRRQQEEAA